jgi:NFU1 iron-sulfur cluster scaffold homolog, mitochondrial
METKNSAQERMVSLYMESNPNPQSLKFVANYMLLPEGISYDFPDKESAKDSDLALRLFNFPYVRRVFFMGNFVTITKDPEVIWEEIRNILKEEIKTFLESGKPLLNEDPVQEIYDENDSEIVKKIKGILDEYIRPAVEQDGGAIAFHSYEAGKVKVLLQGSCSGCPSSTVTLKAGIENLLKRMLPEIQTVEAEGV